MCFIRLRNFSVELLRDSILQARKGRFMLLIRRFDHQSLHRVDCLVLFYRIIIFFPLRTLNVCKCHKGIWDVGGITPLILHLGPEISDNGGPQTRYGRVLEVMICRAGRVSKCDSLNNVLSLFHQINSSQYLCNTRREIQIQTKLDQPP